LVTAEAVIALESVTIDPLIAVIVEPAVIPRPDTTCPRCKLLGEIVAGSQKTF